MDDGEIRELLAIATASRAGSATPEQTQKIGSNDVSNNNKHRNFRNKVSTVLHLPMKTILAI
jgi:hypothetical protein